MTNPTNFVELPLKRGIKLRQNEKRKTVRISFLINNPNVTKVSYKQLIIYIGSDIADSLDLHRGDRITFSYDPNNPYIWLLKKSEDYTGFKLHGTASSPALKMTIAWDLFEIKDSERFVRLVEHEIVDNGIMIRVPHKKGKGEQK